MQSLKSSIGRESVRKPVDLRKLFGDRYKIAVDESASCEPGGRKNPWYFQIPCKYGHVYPHSHQLLAYYCDSGLVRGRLHREHPEIEVRQWSDIGEAVCLFQPEQFNVIAVYARPRRKRQLTAAEKARRAEVLRDNLKKARNCREKCSAASVEPRSRVREWWGHG